MPAADGHAVDRGDDRLGDVANHLVQCADLEHPRLARAVVAGLGALLDVAAGAERLVPGAGEDDRLDLAVGPGQPERLDEFFDGLGAEGVVALRAVDRHDRRRVLHDVGDVLERRHRRFSWLRAERLFIEWSFNHRYAVKGELSGPVPRGPGRGSGRDPSAADPAVGDPDHDPHRLSRDVDAGRGRRRRDERGADLSVLRRQAGGVAGRHRRHPRHLPGRGAGGHGGGRR